MSIKLFRSVKAIDPLREAVFRRIWSASLLSNLGQMILSVGAAWAMTQLTVKADLVALVQTASMLPVVLVSIISGAIADTYDRRAVAIVGLLVAFVSASVLASLSLLGLVNTVNLLCACFAIGCGVALFGPAWQASVSEQVPAYLLPSAVALNSISYNLARSFGPAIGGIIVATSGSSAAFAATATLYLPLLIVLYRWRRVRLVPRLPPERLARAIVSGLRYAILAPAIRVSLQRCVVSAFISAGIVALMPLVARDLLGGGARTFGLLLGSFGLGAVIGALNVASLLAKVEVEVAVRACNILLASAIAVVSLSKSLLLTVPALVMAGGSWVILITMFNITVQMNAPRWVAGRALAAYQTAIAGGLAFGSWFWGRVADGYGVEVALLISAILICFSPLLGIWLRMPTAREKRQEAGDNLSDPDVRLALTARSGPIVVEIDYAVDPGEARAFYQVMTRVQMSRQRNGAYGWSISRDVANPESWTERFHCPTWLDYLHQRNRSTSTERAIHAQAAAFQKEGLSIKVRRMLERPVGSVRWQENTPDPHAGEASISSPSPAP